MRNIEHVLTHFDDPLDYKHWIRVNEHFMHINDVQREVEQAIEQDRFITLSIAHSEIMHSESVADVQRVYAHIRTVLGSGSFYRSPNLSTMRHLIWTTEQLLDEWITGTGYECPVDSKCNKLI